ncbi:MAG: hypothetical protein KBC43_01250 [Bacteroidales bacterium]|nr:hypothetical protein [Bacteroidales bacterium]
MKKTKFLDYLIIIFLIIYMDVPFFMGDRLGQTIFLGVLLIIYFFRSIQSGIDKEFILILLLTFFIIGIQGYLWEFKLMTMFSYLGLVVLLPYLALKILGIRFLVLFSKVIYIISVYTFILWAAQNLIPAFDSYLQNLSEEMFEFGFDEWPRSIIFYTVGGYNDWSYLEDYGIYRNSGVFHEPGAFAVFIGLAIAINVITDKKLIERKNVFLMIVLISTLSTAGIFALFITVLLYYLTIRRRIRPAFSIIATILVSVLFYSITLSVNFLGDKVVTSYEEEASRSLDEETSGRFFSARKAVLVLTRYPITGKGITSSVREDMAAEEDTGGYGFMSFFAQIGIIMSILFTIYFIKGVKRLSLYYSGYQYFWQVLFFGIAINLFSQRFIDDSIFMMIFYVGALQKYSPKYFGWFQAEPVQRDSSIKYPQQRIN